MNDLCRDVLRVLGNKTLSVAESCTGGGIGAALTAVPGSSAFFKGGVICYCNEVKEQVLGVNRALLDQYGAVSSPVAGKMAAGVRAMMKTDIAVSVTGLAGPDGDSFGNPVGTVYIGYEDCNIAFVNRYCFDGDREDVRTQAIVMALKLILDNN